MKNKYLYLFVFFLFTFVLIFSGSLNQGDQYYSKLQKWYVYAGSNDWANADELEKQLDPADTVNYKSTHRPEELKKYINNIILKKDKTVEDWLELARVQSILGKTDDAYVSITTAKNLDPIRDDIGQLYYQTK